MTKEELLKQAATLEQQAKQYEVLFHSTNGALGFVRFLLKQMEDEEASRIKETADEVHKV